MQPKYETPDDLRCAMEAANYFRKLVDVMVNAVENNNPVLALEAYDHLIIDRDEMITSIFVFYLGGGASQVNKIVSSTERTGSQELFEIRGQFADQFRDDKDYVVRELYIAMQANGGEQQAS